MRHNSRTVKKQVGDFENPETDTIESIEMCIVKGNARMEPEGLGNLEGRFRLSNIHYSRRRPSTSSSNRVDREIILGMEEVDNIDEMNEVIKGSSVTRVCSCGAYRY